MALACATAACDAGSPDDQQRVTGPPIHLVASGTNVGSGVAYTVDQPITLAFDRFLDPSSVTRQSVLLEDSSGAGVTEALIAYDPVTLTVSLRNPQGSLAWLTAGQDYRVVLGIPSSDGGNPNGLVAIDGATLSAPVSLIFTAGAAPSPPSAGPPTMDFCRDIYVPIFQYSCAYGTCHVAPPTNTASFDAGGGPLGLDLSSASGVRATAIGQVADESNTGPLASVATQSTGEPFGIDMAVISAGQPGLSWLMYKTLLAVPAAPAAEAVGLDAGNSTYDQSLVSPISTAERARLSDYILGQSMPYPVPPVAEPSVGALTEGDLERLSLWIAQGAVTPTSCPQ